MSPQRIQLRRTKGWRKPEGAIVVSRPSKWGNPFRVSVKEVNGHRRIKHVYLLNGPGGVNMRTPDKTQAVQWAVNLFRECIVNPLPGVDVPTIADIQRELAGHDLACWCPLDGQPCHGSILLELANSRLISQQPCGCVLGRSVGHVCDPGFGSEER